MEPETLADDLEAVYDTTTSAIVDGDVVIYACDPRSTYTFETDTEQVLDEHGFTLGSLTYVSACVAPIGGDGGDIHRIGVER